MERVKAGIVAAGLLAVAGLLVASPAAAGVPPEGAGAGVAIGEFNSGAVEPVFGTDQNRERW